MSYMQNVPRPSTAVPAYIRPCPIAQRAIHRPSLKTARKPFRAKPDIRKASPSQFCGYLWHIVMPCAAIWAGKASG